MYVSRKSRTIAVFAMVFLIVFAGSCLAQSVPDDVLPPDILPVVIISGSDYEMGVQYGQQAGHLIAKSIVKAWASNLRRYSKEDVWKGLKASQYYIEKYTPEFIDMIRGIADGMTAAGYPAKYTDILLLNCTLPNPITSKVPAEAEDAEMPPEKNCSVCSAWGKTTKSGKLIGMDTLDGGSALFGVVVIAYPDKGNAYMTGAEAGAIGSHFNMNNKGLFIGNSGGGGSPRSEDQNYGISWFCSLPYMARFANTATQARDMMLKWQIDIAENFHLVDVHGNAYVIEKTSALQSVRKPGDFGETDFMYSTNNYLNDAMKITKKGGFVKKHGGYGAYAAPRNMMLWDMLHNYSGSVDVEFVKMILRFPGNPPPYPPEGGWDAKICRPSNSWVSVLLPDDGNKGIAHICTGPAGRVIHSSMGFNGRTMHSNYQYIDGTHTFFELALAEKPADVVRRANRSAQTDIATAYKNIMGMNYTDTGYGALEKLYNLANKEFFTGDNYADKAEVSSGNDRMKNLALAATYYTRAQAHAKQVTEALSPAPTSPTDLGLKPFGGNWAKWETRVGTK